MAFGIISLLDSRAQFGYLNRRTQVAGKRHLDLFDRFPHNLQVISRTLFTLVKCSTLEITTIAMEPGWTPLDAPSLVGTSTMTISSDSAAEKGVAAPVVRTRE